jgi:hypothetical protein
MESRKEATLKTYFAIAKKKGKPYVYSSQRRTLELLDKYHGFTISRRTLNRDLREMEDEGYIWREQRHRRAKDGTFVPGSTLTHFKARAFDWFARGLMSTARIFSSFHVPKVALNRFNTTRYLSSVDNLASLITRFIQKGAPAAVFRTA